jgi:hypothetical protein
MPKNKQILKVNKYPIHLENNDSLILIKDNYGNSMRISKNENQSIVLNLAGNFKSE